MSKTIDLKQLRYQLAYGLVVPKKSDPHLTQLLSECEEPEIHGDKVWDSSYLIMDYFRHHPLPQKPISVMEAGCGWGLLSIYLAKIWKAKVTGVDADKHVFPFLDFHASLNGVKINKQIKRYEKLSKKYLSRYDTIVGSDICFWDELTPALFNMIKGAMSANVRQIIIADPGRSPFHKLAKKCKQHFNSSLLDWEVTEPNRHDGELLIIQNG